MKISRPAKRATTWIACFAILLNALAPIASQAIAGSGERPLLWDAIAEHAGLAHLASLDDISRDGAHQHPAKAHHGGHCPFCLAHAGSFALAATAAYIFIPFGNFDPPISSAYRSALPRLPRVPEQPRAPPLVS